MFLRGRWLRYAALGEAMRLSRFEVHAAVQRLMAAQLVIDTEGQPRPALDALRSFVIFGAPYACPAVRGGIIRGFPTAHGMVLLKDMMASPQESPPVWPDPEGVSRGPGLPLYPGLPLAAFEDPALYESSALFDAVRIGAARERQLATTELSGRLGDGAAQENAT